MKINFNLMQKILVFISALCYNVICSSLDEETQTQNPAEKLRKHLDTTCIRRCGRCQESVKFVEKDRFPEIMYPIQTDIQEENGMQIFRL